MSGWSDPRGWFPRNFTMIEKGIVILIVVMLALILWAGKAQNEARLKFMEGCMRDHEEYECTLMWKEAQPDTQTVIVPVYQ